LVVTQIKWLLGIVLCVGVGVTVQAAPPGSADEIRARTMPMGQLCRAGMSCGGQTAAADGSAGAALTGEQIYNQFCFACHAMGISNAPKFGSAEDWAPRVAKGMDALMTSTINGLNVMPAKGTCMACSDDELRGVVDYMVQAAQ